jgi:hypothetical protein
MSHRPLMLSLQVKTPILLTTVAGRSSMDLMPGRSIRPVHEAGRSKPEATMTAFSFTLGLSQRPATAGAWHLCTVIIPRRTITGRLVRGQVWRRYDGRHWLYKKFIA